MKGPDLQLDVLAIVRSRVDSNDADFYSLVDGMSSTALVELLSYTAAFAGLVIQEMQDKLRTLVPEASTSLVDSSVHGYLDSAIKEILK